MTTEPTTPKYSLRASFFSICSKCPGAWSNTEGAQIRLDSDNPQANVGTITHEVCAEIVHDGERPEIAPWLREHGHTDIDEDEIGRLTWHAQTFWQEHGHLFLEPETELPLETIVGDFRITGHTDVLAYCSDCCRVLDWKGGYRTEVDCEPQIRVYGFLALRQRPVSQEDEVKVTVVWLRDQTFQTWTWTRQELEDWMEETLDRIQHWNGLYTVGSHCRYCPNMFNCPAQTTLVKSTITGLGEIDGQDGPVQVAQLAEIYAGVQNVERLIKAYRERLKMAISANGPIPLAEGMELALTVSQTETIDPLQGWAVLDSYFTDPKQLAACIKISKPKFLSAVAANVTRSKGLAKEEAMQRLRDAGAISTSPRESLRLRKQQKAIENKAE